MSAASGSFSGSITGGNININNMFTVDYLGNVITNGNVTLSPGEGKQLTLQSPKIETEMLEIDLGYCANNGGMKIIGEEPEGNKVFLNIYKSGDWHLFNTTYITSGDSAYLQLEAPVVRTIENVEIGDRNHTINNYVEFWTATVNFNCRSGVVFDCPVEFNGDGVTFNCPVTFNGTVTGI